MVFLILDYLRFKVMIAICVVLGLLIIQSPAVGER